MPYNPTDPYRPLFGSLSDQKTADLAVKYEQKKASMEPTPAPIVDPRNNPLLGEAGGSNLIDVGQASLARAGGNLADLGRSISNELLGTEFDASAEEGWSDPVTADIAAGVSPELRAKLQAETQQVMTDVAEGDYGSALINALKAAPGVAAESFATIPEVAIGAAATAIVPPLGAAMLGRKVKSAAETAGKVKKAYDKAKDLKEANRLGKLISSAKNLPAATAKAAGQASILTADLTQQQIQDYRAEHGEDPSPARTATMALGVLATTIWEPAIIANLFIPNFRKELVKEGQNLVKNLGKDSNLKNIGLRIGDAFKKIGKAGAAEAGQEYIQTWQEILAVHITPEQANDLWSSVASKLDEKTLQDQALTGGILGGFAGGVTRAAITAPAVAAGTAVDAAKATVKGTVKTVKKTAEVVGKTSQEIATGISLKALSPKEREILKNKYEIRKAVVEEKSADYDDKRDVVRKATSFADIVADEGLSPFARTVQKGMKATDEEMESPANLKALKDALERKFKANKAVLKTELEASNIARAASKIGKTVGEETVQAAKAAIKKVPVEKVIEIASNYGEAAVTAVKEIRSSAALGMVEIGLEGGKGSTRLIMEAAKGIELADLQRTAEVIGKKNKDLGKLLLKEVKKRETALGGFGQRSTDLITEETLSPIIADIATKGEIADKNVTSAAIAIQETMAGRIADNATLEQVKAVVETYKESTAYKDQTSGAISEVAMDEIDARLKTAESRIAREEKTGKVTKAAKDLGAATVKVVKEGAKVVKEAVKEGLRDKKVLSEGALHDKLRDSEKLLAFGQKGVDELKGSTKQIVKALRKAGYETAEDLNDLIEQFPGFGQNTEFYGILQNQFTTDVLMNEDVDLESKSTIAVASKFLVDVYENLTGCKS